MWKTETIEVGRELQLDPPNESAVVRIVPLEWMSNNRQAELLAQIDEAYKRSEAASAAGDNEASVRINLEMMVSVLGAAVRSWTIKHPETGEMLPVNDESLRLLPTPIVMRIFSAFTRFDSIPGSEADKESGLPLVKPAPSESTSSEPTPLTSTASSS